MENLRKAVDRSKFHDDEMNWKNFGYVEIFEEISVIGNWVSWKWTSLTKIFILFQYP